MVIAKLKKLEKKEENLLVSNLRFLVHEEGISEGELSRRTSIPQPTLHKILSGTTVDPRISTIKTLADYFETPMDFLCSKKVTGLEKSLPKSKHIPIVSWSSCIDQKLTSGLSAHNCPEWIIVDDTLPDLSYALQSRPSMEPRFQKGTLLIVDPSIQPSDGNLVIVLYPKATEAAIREFSIDGPKKLLKSINQNSVPEPLDKSIEIIGTVVQYRFSY